MRRQGETAETFTDHTDVRPTLLYLTGLSDDYAHDGRVIVEALDESVPQRETLSRLAAAYKQINAPLGELGRRTLMISTRALTGDAATYNALEEEIASVTAQRNAIAGRMIAVLEAAAFQHMHVDEDEARRLTDAAGRLIESVRWTPGGVAGASATDRDRIAVSGGSVPRRTPPPPRAARQ